MIPGVASNISDNVVTIGSFVAFTCETDSNEHKIVVAECMSNGKFHPDPGSLSCVNGMFLCHTVLENCICKAITIRITDGSSHCLQQITLQNVTSCHCPSCCQYLLW